MDRRFERKVVLITDANNAVGRALTLAFAAQGARTAFAVADEETKCSILKDAGQNVQLFSLIGPFDTDKQLNDIFEAVVKNFGTLDVLINTTFAPFLSNASKNSSAKNMEYIFNKNFRTPHFMTELFLPLLEKCRGCIVNTSSIMGSCKLVDGPCTSFYSASKAALDAWVKADSFKLAKSGVRINNVCLGFVEGVLYEETVQGKAELKDAIERIIPIGIGTASDYVPTYLFLASTDRDFITGACVTVDGGLSWAGR